MTKMLEEWKMEMAKNHKDWKNSQLKRSTQIKLSWLYKESEEEQEERLKEILTVKIRLKWLFKRKKLRDCQECFFQRIGFYPAQYQLKKCMNGFEDLPGGDAIGWHCILKNIVFRKPLGADAEDWEITINDRFRHIERQICNKFIKRRPFNFEKKMEINFQGNKGDNGGHVLMGGIKYNVLKVLVGFLFGVPLLAAIKPLDVITINIIQMFFFTLLYAFIDKIKKQITRDDNESNIEF